MNSVWRNIVTIPVFLQVFSLAAWLVWWSELALCDWTRTESGKTLDSPDEGSAAFVNSSVSQKEKDKENTVFGWAGAEEAAGLHCEDRPTTGAFWRCQEESSAAMLMSLLRSITVGKWTDQIWDTSPSPQTHFSDAQVQHLLSAKVCWDSCIRARPRQLRHLSPWLQNLSQILCTEQNCYGNSIRIHLLLPNVMWGKAVMVVQDSGLIHFSTLNTSFRSTSR